MRCPRYVCSSPDSDQRADIVACLKGAMCGRMHRKQRLTRSPPSARVSSDCGTDGQQRYIDYSHRAGAYSAWRRPNLQLRRQTDQRRRNGWHELAGHDRTMQLFMAFACLEGRARIIGIEEDADRIGRELPRGKLISTLSSPAILFANHAAPCRQALGGMLLHPLGELRRAHQAGLYRDVSEVRGGDGLLVAICRRGETAEHGDDLYHDRRTPSLRWALAPLTL
jgi:hypothetical protein